MDAPGPEPILPVLGYAAPPVYFCGQYRYRSANGIGGVAFGVVLGAGAFWGPARIVSSSGASGVLPGFVVSLFRVAGIALFGLSAYGIWLAIVGRQWDVLLTEDGITRNGCFHAWQDIRCFSALLTRKDVMLQFERREGLPFPHAVELTPPLSVEQYRALARNLVDQLGPKYPDLKVEVEPRIELLLAHATAGDHTAASMR